MGNNKYNDKHLMQWQTIQRQTMNTNEEGTIQLQTISTMGNNKYNDKHLIQWQTIQKQTMNTLKKEQYN